MESKKFILSQGGVNSSGFIVRTRGIRTSNFMENPVMLWMHLRASYGNPELMPIGRWKNLEFSENDELIGEPEFDMDDELAVKISKKVEKGYIKAASIGFEVLAIDVEYVEGKEVLVVTESELLEASICDIGDNRSALKLYYKGKPIVPVEGQSLSLALQELVHKTPNIADMKKVALTLGLPESSNEDAIVAGIQAIVKRAETAEGEIVILKKEKEDAAANFLKKRAEDLVKLALSQGKITAAQQPTYLALAEKDYEAVETLLSGMKSYEGLSGKLNPEGKDANDPFKDWDFKKLHREAPKELARIKKEEPARYQELFNRVHTA